MRAPVPVRAVAWIAYIVVLALVGIFWLIADHSREDLPHAAYQLEANHLIIANDLRTRATDALIGRFLRSQVEQDKPISADMVSDQPTVPPIPVGISAVVMINKAIEQRLNLGKGTLVQIQRAHQPIVDRAIVQATVCDETNCSVYLTLAKVPADLDAASLAGAELVPLGPLPNAVGGP